MNYSLTLTKEEVDQVATILSGQPYRDVVNLMVKLHHQVQAQNTAESKASNGSESFETVED